MWSKKGEVKMEALQMEIINTVIVALTVLIGWTTKHVVVYLKEKGIVTKLDKNKALVRIAVDAVEQTYKTLHGKEKLNLAKIEVLKLAKSKGIKISEKELDLLIESAVKEMNDTIKKELKK